MPFFKRRQQSSENSLDYQTMEKYNVSNLNLKRLYDKLRISVFLTLIIVLPLFYLCQKSDSNMRNLCLFLVLVSTVLTVSCSKEDQREIDKNLIEEYIEVNNLAAEEGPEGLFFVVDKTGSGTTPNLNSNVRVHYRGTLLDGTKFDSSFDRGQPAEFKLFQVIEGWQLGIPLFREGGKGKLIIPSHLGYGGNPPRGSVIPSNAVLVFDIELLDVF
jgi:FKBP-type peptidyl-prolyl cis-trans isomerase FkpA